MDLSHHRDTDSRFDVPLSEIGSDLIQEFHRHWLLLWHDGRLPSRADIDPANFKRILPNVILAEIEADPFRVRYRLCGTRVVEFCGNLTGRYLDQLDGADLWATSVYTRQYQIAVGERRPVFSYDWMEGAAGGRNFFQTGIWPLARDGAHPDMCIAVEDYFDLQRADLKASTDKITR
ncbi:MAG TPA: PAS domain-containing protein [Dongiaceae bacterium]|nr:PAS domain-containing protein [Dongiaceae bacterium]